MVKPGRLFLRRLIDLSTTVSRLHHRVSLNKEALADIDWWIEFLPNWNGVEMIQSPMVSSVSLKLATDASGVGIGAHFGDHWFSIPLDHFHSIAFMQQDPDQAFDINRWELFSLVTAVFTWGHLWANQQILVYVDNMTLTYVWARGCKDKCLMHLIRALFLFTAQHNINIMLQHVPGISNVIPDLLSRLQVDQFRLQLPSADPDPTPISDLVWQL